MGAAAHSHPLHRTGPRSDRWRLALYAGPARRHVRHRLAVMARKARQMAGLKVDPEVDAGRQVFLQASPPQFGRQRVFLPARRPAQTHDDGGRPAVRNTWEPGVRTPAVDQGDRVPACGTPPSRCGLIVITGITRRRSCTTYKGRAEVGRRNRQMRRVLIETQASEGCAAGSWDPNEPDQDPWGRVGGRLMQTSLSCPTRSGSTTATCRCIASTEYTLPTVDGALPPLEPPKNSEPPKRSDRGTLWVVENVAIMVAERLRQIVVAVRAKSIVRGSRWRCGPHWPRALPVLEPVPGVPARVVGSRLRRRCAGLSESDPPASRSAAALCRNLRAACAQPGRRLVEAEARKSLPSGWLRPARTSTSS